MNREKLESMLEKRTLLPVRFGGDIPVVVRKGEKMNPTHGEFKFWHVIVGIGIPLAMALIATVEALWIVNLL